MAKHNSSRLSKIADELRRRNLDVRVTSKGHLLIKDPATGKTTMIGGESIGGGRNNRNVHNAKMQLRIVGAHDISTLA